MQSETLCIIPHASSIDKSFNYISVPESQTVDFGADLFNDDPIDMPPDEAAPETYEDDSYTLACAYLSDNL